jgi:hypothetical protein
MSVELQRRRFTVDKVLRDGRGRHPQEDDRVEPIEGEIIQMAAIGSQHAACVGRLNQMVTEQLGAAALVWPQNPVRLSDLSEPRLSLYATAGIP